VTVPFLTSLYTDQLRALDVPEPWSFGMADKVRFGEIDALGHVNNAVYLRWYETLRVNYLHDYGVYEASIPAPKIVVKTVGLDFKAEVKPGAEYINLARAVEMRNTSFTMHYATLVDGQVTTTGHAVVVLLNDDNSKRKLPDALRATLVARDATVQI
jgi:acyl-CoA thioester hydrolase